MEPGAPTAAQAFETSQLRRAEMGASIKAVEQAVAAGGRKEVWIERLRVALERLTVDFQKHVERDHSGDGMAHTVVVAAPRLSHAVTEVARERVELMRRIHDLLAYLGEPPATVSPDRAREQSSALIERLLRHLQRGSDLLHEADQPDIGGEG